MREVEDWKTLDLLVQSVQFWPDAASVLILLTPSALMLRTVCTPGAVVVIPVSVTPCLFFPLLRAER